MIEDMLDLITVVPAAGTLPPSWGSHGCFADLIQLGMWNMNVSGPLPPEWGMPASFKKLGIFGHPQLQHHWSASCACAKSVFGCISC